jgi:8-oxo-dGTP pyrophosphatase MutT (NUDIX family)
LAEPRAVIPASTLLLVRDAPGLQVLMVERHYEIDFAAGALVFPGGKLATDDARPSWAGLSDADPAMAAGERAFRVGAVREAFEESALLLARPAQARGVGRPLADAEAVASLQELRAAIAAGEESFFEAMQAAGLVLALDALTPFAHWVTPTGMPKRFDTWFYIAATPGAQIAVHDGHETTEAVWVDPAAAVADAHAGRRKIIFPTRLNLEMLAASGATSAAAIAAAQVRTIVTVEPKVVTENGELVLTIPAEAGYSVTREPLSGNLP